MALLPSDPDVESKTLVIDTVAPAK